jgi:hypothetical protein
MLKRLENEDRKRYVFDGCERIAQNNVHARCFGIRHGRAKIKPVERISAAKHQSNRSVISSGRTFGGRFARP